MKQSKTKCKSKIVSGKNMLKFNKSTEINSNNDNNLNKKIENPKNKKQKVSKKNFDIESKFETKIDNKVEEVDSYNFGNNDNVSRDIYAFIDPITLTPIEANEKQFIFLRPNGTKICYRASSLAKYLLYSGDFREPVSKLDFSNQDLLQLLDLISKEEGEKLKSLQKHKNSFMNEKSLHSNVVFGLENCCGELVGRIPFILEESDSREEAYITLLTEIFPQLKHYHTQLAKADLECSKLLRKQYLNFILGPPNRPNEDKLNLHKVCKEFLEEDLF